MTLEKPEEFTDDDRETIRRLLENHAKLTGSPVARAILDDWERSCGIS